MELLTNVEMLQIKGGAGEPPVKPVPKRRPNDYYDDEDGDESFRQTGK